MAIDPDKIYKALLKYFGPQGWWPTTRKGNFIPGYHNKSAKKSSTAEKFEICLGAILTQNTSWKNVEKAIENLNRAKALDIGKIGSLNIQKLALLIKPSGYYNQKAARLKNFALHFKQNFEKIFKNSLMSAREELLSLKGIGPETADSILLYAGNYPVFVVDAYTIRISQRLGLFKTRDYKSVQEYFQNSLPKSALIYNEFHALFVALGKDFCRKKPLCEACPLRRYCNYGKKHG